MTAKNIFKTKRLILRPLEKTDYNAWVEAYSILRPAQNEWDESAWKKSELSQNKFNQFLSLNAKKSKIDQEYFYAIFRKDDGALIGFIRLMDISRMIFQNAYLGYRIFNNYWGYGYAKEAVSKSIEIAFKKLKLHRIEAAIAPKNIQSIRVAESAGLRFEGQSKKRLYVNNRWQDMLIYAATCEDFKIRDRSLN